MPSPASPSSIAFSLGAALLVLYPPLGAALIGLTSLFTGRAERGRGWTLLWGGFLVPSATLLLFLGEAGSLIRLAAQAALGLAAAVLLRARPGPARTGIQVGMGLLLATMLISQAAAPFLWNNRATDNIARHLLTRLATGEEEIRGSRSRTWVVPAGADEAVLRFSARRTAGLPGWDWLANDGVSVTPVVKEERLYSRLRFGTSGDPYAQRIVGTGAPVGGRSFRVSLEVRAARPAPPRGRGCRGVWLQVWGEGGGSSCGAVDPTGDWTRIEHEWTAPEDASSSIVRIILNDFDDSTIEVRDVRLWERRESGWDLLSPLVPEGIALYLHRRTAGGGEERLFAFVPGEARTGYGFRIPLEPAPESTSVTATIETATGVGVAVGDISFTTPAGGLRPAIEVVRQALWFDHPNLVAHSVATSGLVAVLLGRTPLQSLASFALAAATLLPAGGRTALAVFLPAATALMLLSFRERRRLVLAFAAPALLVAAVAVGASLAGSSTVARALPLNTGQTTSRVSIWRFALEVFVDRPVAGLAGSGETLEALWRERGPTRERVPHAHNLLLEFALRYGVPGLLSAFWLSAGLLLVAWHRARWIGCAFAAAVLLMNQFDVSLFYGGVLFPLVLGINVLGEGGRADPERVGEADRAPRERKPR